MKIFKNITLLLLLASIGVSFAGNVYCSGLTINEVFVEGDRQGNYEEQKLYVKFSKACNGKYWGYIENTKPAYSGLLTMALVGLKNKYEYKVRVRTDKTDGTGSELPEFKS